MPAGQLVHFPSRFYSEGGTLFGLQGDHRVDTRSAAGRDVVGDQSEQRQRAHGAAEGDGVESPRGVSPRGAHRTVREPLDSHGSYHPAARGVTPAAHWENNFGSRLATFTNQRDALRFRL